MSISDFLAISQIARNGRRFAWVLVRQREDIERIAILRMVHVRFYHPGNIARTAATEPMTAAVSGVPDALKVSKVSS